MTVIEFVDEHPVWTLVYLFVVCCTITSCFYSMFGTRHRKKSEPD
jgi:hypothetical protein